MKKALSRSISGGGSALSGKYRSTPSAQCNDGSCIVLGVVSWSNGYRGSCCDSMRCSRRSWWGGELRHSRFLSSLVRQRRRGEREQTYTHAHTYVQARVCCRCEEQGWRLAQASPRRQLRRMSTTFIDSVTAAMILAGCAGGGDASATTGVE